MYAFGAVFHIVSGVELHHLHSPRPPRRIVLKADAISVLGPSPNYMGRSSWTRASVACAVSILAAITHGHGSEQMSSHGGMGHENARPTLGHANSSQDVSTYFRYSGHSSWMTAHIILMTIGWAFVLPLGESMPELSRQCACLLSSCTAVMLAIPQSRLSLPAQLSFAALNIMGLICGIIYNADTPDLYPNNVHHGLGWLLSGIVAVQVLLGIVNAYARINNAETATTYIPVSREAIAEHQRISDPGTTETSYRFSNDSGQGTERNTESLRSNSLSSAGEEDQVPCVSTSSTDRYRELEKNTLLGGGKMDEYLSTEVSRMSNRMLRTCRLAYGAIDRIILILGFIGLATGFVTYAGIFVSTIVVCFWSLLIIVLQMRNRVFSGLAHFVKGGVFFWYGILTLGRWAGCFADIGWV